MERSESRQIAEALILAGSEPVSAERLAAIVPGATPAVVRELVDELNADYTAQGRSFEIWEVAGGYQLRTRPDYAVYVQQLHALGPARLSAPALETLAVVAYRQPVTRAEIEHVRGVDVGATLRSLVERRLVRIAGHRDVPGRPLLYATTRRFLEVFGLGSLADLPNLRDLQELGGGEPLAPQGEAPTADAAAPAEASAQGDSA